LIWRNSTDQAAEILNAYPKDAEVVWAQEEPPNMGAWHFIHDQIEPLLDATAPGSPRPYRMLLGSALGGFRFRARRL
jgi:2-oxoglutarate dehydrogenase complex dehydrogenase (E1) component-like enzyme